MSRLKTRLAHRWARFRKSLFNLSSNIDFKLHLRGTDVGSAPRLLMIDELVPDPHYGAGYPRAREMLESIAAFGWQVSFYAMIASPDEIRRMRKAGISNVFFHGSDGRTGLRRLIDEHASRFDAMLISRPPVISGFRQVLETLAPSRSSAYRVYDAEALFSPREELRRSLFVVEHDPDRHQLTLDAELSLLGDADAIVAVSHTDAEVFREHTQAKVFVVGHRMKSTPTQTIFAARSDLLFVGRLEAERDESPNVDSLVWFVEKIMPELDTLMGTEYRLQVAGLVNSDQVRALSSDRVVLHGVVDNLTQLYGSCKVFIAPTRYAAGIPRKIHDAFSHGIPCVSTSLLARQLGMLAAPGLLVADDPKDFATCCRSLYTDAQMWTRTRDAALERLERDFSERAFDDSLQRLLDSVPRVR